MGIWRRKGELNRSLEGTGQYDLMKQNVPDKTMAVRELHKLGFWFIYNNILEINTLDWLTLSAQ